MKRALTAARVQGAETPQTDNHSEKALSSICRPQWGFFVTALAVGLSARFSAAGGK
jgi:hypothetical protein